MGVLEAGSVSTEAPTAIRAPSRLVLNQGARYSSWRMYVEPKPTPGVVDLVNLEHCPMEDLDSEEGASFARAARRRFLESGLCVLPDFIRPEALAILAEEANSGIGDAWFCNGAHNVYLDEVPPDLPADDIATREVRTFVGSIPYDRLNEDGPRRCLYQWDPLSGRTSHRRSRLTRWSGEGSSEEEGQALHGTSGSWLTASRNPFPALSEGTVDAAISMGSPVRGLRPCRAGRCFTVNVPNPATLTTRTTSLVGKLERSLVDARQHLGALDPMHAKLPLVIDVEVVAVEQRHRALE